MISRIRFRTGIQNNQIRILFSNRYPEQLDTYSFFEQVSRSNKYPEYRYGYKSGCGLEIFRQFQAHRISNQRRVHVIHVSESLP